MPNKSIFISMPMKDKTEDEIRQQFGRAKKELTEWGYDVKDSIINPSKEILDKCHAPGLHYLGESLKILAQCQYAYFCKGWEYAGGCRIEHIAAVEYGIEIIYE